MSNSRIVDEIRAAIRRDPRIHNAAEVAVAEREGTVTLRGTVRGLRARHAAVEVAQSVPGVRAVEDGLRVDPRDHFQDAEIRGAALQALMSSDRVPQEVDVNVADGWLTLRGRVKHQSESDAAFEAVSKLPGVGGITNRIVVVTAG
jgi:osmotically-inducible protein OsmY